MNLVPWLCAFVELEKLDIKTSIDHSIDQVIQLHELRVQAPSHYVAWTKCCGGARNMKLIIRD